MMALRQLSRRAAQKALVPVTLVPLAMAGLTTAAAAQYYYPAPRYYPAPPPAYYPQPQPYYPAPQPYYTPRPSRASVAERCATPYGVCQIGPTRAGRQCSCYFPDGKVFGTAVR